MRKVDIDIPIGDFVKISFDGELVDDAEKGDFYYKITAHASDQTSDLRFWESSIVSRARTSLQNKAVANEILKEIKSKVNKEMKNKKGRK